MKELVGKRIFYITTQQVREPDSTFGLESESRVLHFFDPGVGSPTKNETLHSLHAVPNVATHWLRASVKISYFPLCGTHISGDYTNICK